MDTGSLTDIAGFDIFFDLGGHSFPEVMPAEQFKGFGRPEVARVWVIVVDEHDFSP
jgi:hypothetical protein